ncbi:hypothetical protein [Thiorhodococcus fuscus]|uniref:Uncharacterized protein n=1 Tax=Thiorhodococcus fuscus TaxID=527200 RepID=A0ABW4Y7X4_9GAMM
MKNGLEMFETEWAEGLAGLSGEDIRCGIAWVRANSGWPPSIAEFRSACRAGMTAEQRAFAARLSEAESDRLALPSMTRAEQLAKGAKKARAMREEAARPKSIARSQENIRRGRWTPEMEDAYRRSMQHLGLRYVAPEWPEASA